MNIVYSNPASADYDDMLDMVYREWPLLADDIINRFRQTLDTIRDFPLIGEIVDPPVKGYRGLRFQVPQRVGHRVIYYQIIKNEFWLVRILHSSMDFRAALKK